MNDKWQRRFMSIAEEVATWSKDPSTKVGAIIVSKDKRILATGYNGFPAGVEDTLERLNDRNEKYLFTIHAEMNAILNAVKFGINISNSWLFVSGLPVCDNCAKHIVQSGIETVVMKKYEKTQTKRWQESTDKANKIFQSSKILTKYI